MLAVFVDLFLMLAWPIILSTAAWIIAIRALAERDEISAVVQALTQPDWKPGKLEREVKSPRRSHVGALARRENAGFSDHFTASQRNIPKHKNAETPSDEKSALA